MNLASLLILLLVAVALFFAVRSFVRAGKRGGCGCGSSGCSSCGSGSDCPYCSGKKSSR
ncbi:MAG: FeoB-associated Cys-rich membrane protein [Bacteroidales bacterium]|nr:FeoB-associated Cys-rich membrane protein [Bacteroidales bacterium]